MVEGATVVTVVVKIVVSQTPLSTMERLNIDAVSAFEVLARLSQEFNIKLVDIARQFIDRKHPTTRT